MFESFLFLSSSVIILLVWLSSDNIGLLEDVSIVLDLVLNVTFV